MLSAGKRSRIEQLSLVRRIGFSKSNYLYIILTVTRLFQAPVRRGKFVIFLIEVPRHENILLN